MTAMGVLQIVVFVGALLALVKPLGAYMARVYEGEPLFGLDRLLGPVERLIYRVAGVRAELPSKRLHEWLTYPDVEAQSLAAWLPEGFAEDEVGIELIEDATYAPYLARHEAELRDLRASESLQLPRSFDFSAVPGLSNEMVERLSQAAPDTLAAAGRVQGITPTALAAVMVHARKLQAA